jgi:hypothetical protein
MYGMRNYAQHCGLPIEQLKVESRLSVGNPTVPVHKVSVSMKRDDLLTNFEWHRLVRADISAMAESIDIEPHVEEMMTCIRTINFEMMRDRFLELQQSALDLLALIAEIPPHAGYPHLFTMIDQAENPLATAGQWSIQPAAFEVEAIKAIVRNDYDALMSAGLTPLVN